MKKPLFMLAALLLCGAAQAQQRNYVRLLDNMFNSHTTTPVNPDTWPEEKWQLVGMYADSALIDPKTKDNYMAWHYAFVYGYHEHLRDIESFDKETNENPDSLGFFTLKEKLVRTAMRYYELLQTPNERGRLPYNETQMENVVAALREEAVLPWTKLYAGTVCFLDTDPALAARCLCTFYDAKNHPLFAPMNLDKVDEQWSQVLLYGMHVIEHLAESDHLLLARDVAHSLRQYLQHEDCIAFFDAVDKLCEPLLKPDN